MTRETRERITDALNVLHNDARLTVNGLRRIYGEQSDDEVYAFVQAAGKIMSAVEDLEYRARKSLSPAANIYG